MVAFVYFGFTMVALLACEGPMVAFVYRTDTMVAFVRWRARRPWLRSSHGGAVQRTLATR